MARRLDLRAEDLFDGLKKEMEEKIKRPEIKTNKNLEFIIGKFEKIVDLHINCFDDEDYRKINRLFENESFYSKDIEMFSLLLQKYQKREFFSENAGIYLSCLINRCIEDRIRLNTHGLEYNINNIGARNVNKIILVRGDIGSDIGDEMTGGEIIVNGNAGNFVGCFLSGGKIKIFGSCGNGLGNSMDGGVIRVKGNAGKEVGNNMRGGTIYLNGDYKSLADDYDSGVDDYMSGGDIYHKGKLIVKEGRRVG